jgi:transcriptional regulator GlxA family with amidase domain
MTRTIGILAFDGVELLDFAGPYEVFTCAARVAGKRDGNAAAPFRALTVGATRAPVRARAGLALVPDAAFADLARQEHIEAAAIDVLIVPGGVVSEEMDKPEVIRWIAATAARAELTASVCTGAFLLARAGLLDNLAATTHWEDIAELRAMFPAVRVEEHRRWIDQGRIVTSAGISAGIDMSLHLVERLAGRALALATARQMAYEWKEDSGR